MGKLEHWLEGIMMKLNILIIGLALALLFAGCTGYGNQAADVQKQSAEQKAMAEKKAMENKAMAEKKAMEEKAMKDKEMAEKKAMAEKNSTNNSMMGAGKASYTAYEATAYQKAKSEGKVIYLEFYAPWCPTCRGYEPKLLSAFQIMSADAKYKDVVGFKVDYDTQNDLKGMFGVVGQHTHVIIGKDGKVVVQSREIWSSQDLMDNIGKAL